MHEHDDHRLRLKLRDALRRDSYVLGIKEIPPLPEFTDGMHQEWIRLRDIFRSLRNTELWLDSVYGSPLPSILEARNQSQEALDALKSKCRDGLTYADDNLRIAWRKHLRPVMTRLIDSLVNYTMVLLEESRKEGRFGTRTQLGRTARVSFRPHPSDSPDYLGMRGEFAFDDDKEFDEVVAETPEMRIVDYVPLNGSSVTDMGPAMIHQADIERMVARFPLHARDLFRLEHGLKVEGQREGISILLFHDTAIAVYEQTLEADSLNPSGKGPRKKKRKSILATFGLGVLLMALLALTTMALYQNNAPQVTYQSPTTVKTCVKESLPTLQDPFGGMLLSSIEEERGPEASDAACWKKHSMKSKSSPTREQSHAQVSAKDSPKAMVKPRKSHVSENRKPRSTKPKSPRKMNIHIKPVSETKVYDSIMALIEPELVTCNLAKMREKYKNESPAETKRRMARYSKAFRLYGLCFKEYLRTLDQQAAETNRIAKLASAQRREWMRRNHSTY